MTKRYITVTLLGALIALSVSGIMDKLIGATLLSWLNKQNAQYLDASFNKALSGFIIMSTLKAGLDIIEGSEIGFSLGIEGNLQAGDVV